jgi:hypothetical protein
MEWLPLLLSGVSSIASGVMGSNAASTSTKQLTDALNSAMKFDKQTLNKVLGMNSDTIGQVLGLNRDATNESIRDINGAVSKSLGMTDTALQRSVDTQNAGTSAANTALTNAETRGRADLAPWMQRGAEALEAYSGELGLTMPGGQPYQSKFRTTEGYQFKKSEGEKSVVNNLARLGMKASGAAMKQLDQYGQGIADQEHDDYMANLANLSGQGQQASTNAAQLAAQTGAGVSNNTMTGAGNNAGNILGANNTNVGTVLGGADSTSGIRMGGAANAGGALMTGNNNALDAILNKTGNISDNLVNVGTAQGAGTVGGTNSWTNALKNFTSSLGRTLGSSSGSWGNILGANNFAGGATA